jgi:tetratricopeptide (TPR) repeat protein
LRQGALLCENGESESAIHCLEEALFIRRHNLGERHESCADTQQWIGNVMREWGHYDEALVCFEAALQIKKETLGHDHEGTSIDKVDFYRCC